MICKCKEYINIKTPDDCLLGYSLLGFVLTEGILENVMLLDKNKSAARH